MNNDKTEVVIFDEAPVELNKDIFTNYSFKKHMERIREQKQAGLDMEKVKKVVEDAVSGIDYSDVPEDSGLKRTVILDIDQVCAAHGAETAEQRQALKDKIYNLPEVHDINLICFDEVNMPEEEFISFEILKGRSSTGRSSYQLLPCPPRTNKNHMSPKDGDLFIGWESEVDLSRLEKLYQAGDLVSEFQIVGEDSEMKPSKHPRIFNISDLVADPREFVRLEEMLEKEQKDSDLKGFSMLPILVEAVPGLTVSPDTVDNTMSRLGKLAGEYKVDIFFGPRSALKAVMYQYMYGAVKTAMYQYMYGGRQDDLPKDPGPIVLTGGGLFHDECLVIGAAVAGKNTWKTPNTFRIENQTHGWDQGKLRRGKGHNKFKRKGKK